MTWQFPVTRQILTGNDISWSLTLLLQVPILETKVRSEHLVTVRQNKGLEKQKQEKLRTKDYEDLKSLR